MKYYIWTIGCQMNFSDSRQAAEELDRIGWVEAGRAEEADLVLLNTCVVRQSAEDKVVGRLTSLQGLKRRRPGMRLVLMGCFVDDASILRQRYPWVDAFIAPSDIDSVVALALQTTAGQDRAGGGETIAFAPHPMPVAAGVPISYGCDHLCTYCIVRLRRGREASRPTADIAAQVQNLARHGVREVTLLGQNVDSYGHDLPPMAPGQGPPCLADLLEVVHATEGLVRIRFLTSHPADMTERLIDTAARLPKVCEHIELPVQSGDDVVLRRMGRSYSVAQYRALVERIRAVMPHVGLATDVIVGFPGETAAQFEATYKLLEEVRFDMVHVAAYSPRQGTPAERLPDDVPAEEKERRRRAVDELQERIVGGINAGLLGSDVEVLVEDRHRGKWRGRTRSNKLVFVNVDDAGRQGDLIRVRIAHTGPWSLQGEPVPACLCTRERKGEGDEATDRECR